MAQPDEPPVTDQDAVDPDMTAGELALGLLDGDERAAALRRVLAEPGFAREVDTWRTRLAGLYDVWPEAAPGPALARRVAAIPDGGRATAGRWGWLAAVSSAAAAVLLGVVVLRPVPTPVVPAPIVQVAPALVAVFNPEGADPFGAVFDPTTRMVRLAGAVVVPTDRVAELWTIGDDGVPHAAGLLTPQAGRRLVLARGIGVAAGTTFAISIEPVGGSPKPTPTGPVVAAGKLTAI